MIAHSVKSKTGIRLVTVLLASVMILSAAAAVVAWFIPGSSTVGSRGVRPFQGNIVTNYDKYLNSNVMYQLPETVKDDEEISVILEVKEKPLLQQYQGAGSGMTFTEYAATEEAEAIRQRIAKEKSDLLAAFDKAKLSYEYKWSNSKDSYAVNSMYSPDTNLSDG